MANEKVTPMVIKVDLQCTKCYKKIKKTLGKFPQIRDQVFDEKANTITVTVICCSPEKVRDRLCYKAGKVITGIEIKQAPKPKDDAPQKPKGIEKSKDGAPQKPKGIEKSKDDAPQKPKGIEKPKEAAAEKPEKPKEEADGKPVKPKEAPATALAAKSPPVESVAVNGVPSIFPYVGPTYGGYDVPYYHGYGLPPPPPPTLYEGYYGPGYGHVYNGYAAANYGSGYGYGYGRDGPVRSRYDGHLSEDNPQSCSIM